MAKIEKGDLLELSAGLNRLAGGDYKLKFAYAVARNRSKIKNVVEAIQEVLNPLPEYEKKRIALVNEMCRRDPETDQPIVLPDGQQIISDMALFNRRIEEIKAETGQDKKDEEVKALLKETEDIDFYMVPFETLPETMAPAILQAIMPMVQEPVEAEVVSIKEAASE